MKYVALFFAWACLLSINCGAAHTIGRGLAVRGFTEVDAVGLGVFGLATFYVWCAFNVVATDCTREVE